MRFEISNLKLADKGQKRRTALLFIVLVLLFIPCIVSAAVLDRVVAFVGSDAIMLSELRANVARARAVVPDITDMEVLNTMINRKLLAVEAKKYFPEENDEDALVRDYMDLKIRALVTIPEKDIRDYYNKNKANFGNVGFEQVRGQIEKLLEEKEVNRRLRDQIQDLRARAWIKTFPDAIPAGPPALK